AGADTPSSRRIAASEGGGGARAGAGGSVVGTAGAGEPALGSAGAGALLTPPAPVVVVPAAVVTVDDPVGAAPASWTTEPRPACDRTSSTTRCTGSGSAFA